MATKQEILKEYGISVLDGNSYIIYLKYGDIRLPYNTNNYLFFSTEYFLKDVFKLFNIDKEDIDKKIELKKYGIEIGSIIGDFIEIKKDGKVLKYNYIDYKHSNLEDFITDILFILGVKLEERELRELFLAKRSEYIRKSLNQLRISKCWVGSSFFLQRGEKRIKYDFEDFINKSQELLISDIVNKFNNVDKLEVKNKIDLIINNVDSILDKKEKIKQILKEKGFYDK